MKEIFNLYISVLLLLFLSVTGLCLITTGVHMRAADSFSAAAVAELENSHFHPLVIDRVGEQASRCGYQWEVTLFFSDGSKEELIYGTEESRQNAEEKGVDGTQVISALTILSYDYNIPFFFAGFGNDRTMTRHEIRAFAT